MTASSAAAHPPAPNPPTYPLAIVGAGALGLMIAARLAPHGPVALVARSAARARALRTGVVIETGEVGGTRFVPDVHALEAAPHADWVLIVVKAGDTVAAARIAAAMRPRGVLSLQNGLVGDLLGAPWADAADAPLLGQGVTTMGAHRHDARVTPVSVGETLVPPGFEAVAARLAAAGLPARVEADIAAARLAKLLVNLALNPLTAVFRVATGELLAPRFALYVDALVSEAWPVLRAAGLGLDEAAARARVWAVVRATAANRTSMLQDVLAGRRTELDAISGAFLRLADAAGAAVPTHRALHALVALHDDAVIAAAHRR